MAVPQPGKFPHGTLATVVALCGEDEFVEKRTRVYKKQDEILSNPDPGPKDVQELEQLSDELADYVQLMLNGVSYTYAFTVAALPPGYAAGRPFQEYAAKSAILSPIHLKANLPVLASRAGSAPPKAVYHDQGIVGAVESGIVPETPQCPLRRPGHEIAAHLLTFEDLSRGDVTSGSATNRESRCPTFLVRRR